MCAQSLVIYPSSQTARRSVYVTMTDFLCKRLTRPAHFLHTYRRVGWPDVRLNEAEGGMR